MAVVAGRGNFGRQNGLGLSGRLCRCPNRRHASSAILQSAISLIGMLRKSGTRKEASNYGQHDRKGDCSRSDTGKPSVRESSLIAEPDLGMDERKDDYPTRLCTCIGDVG